MSKRSNEIYTNCYEIVKRSNYFFYIFTGGRGIGKTYSSLKGAYFDNKKIIYLRRTNTELKNCCDEIDNPYKAINIKEHCNIHMEQVKDMAVIYDNIKSTESETPIKELVGYGLDLSTSGKFRGMDFSDVDLVIFDEFINYSDRETIKRESYKLFNLIETINRNRELDGVESIKVILLTNSESLDSDILRTLGLVDKAEQMKANNERLYTDDVRGIYYALLENKAVRDLKRETKLYRLTKGTSFYEMALENEFTRDYFGDIRKVNYQELTPVCSYDNKLFFYEHKSKDIMFVSRRKANCDNYNDRTIESFKRAYGYMLMYFIESGLMLYSDYATKLDVKHIFD